jgi:hypothetical protein
MLACLGHALYLLNWHIAQIQFGLLGAGYCDGCSLVSGALMVPGLVFADGPL